MTSKIKHTQNRKRIQMTLLSAVLLIALFGISLSTAQARTDPAGQPDVSNQTKNPVVTISISPAKMKSTLAFWTRQRIANAQPMEMQSDAEPAAVDEASLFEQDVVGEFGFVPAGAPAPNADKLAKAAYPRDWKMAPVESLTNEFVDDFADEMTGTSQVYTSYAVNVWEPAQTIYPHKWIGRLTFSTTGGTSYCSATAISGNVMLTAAHCIYDTTNNRFYSNWAFTPAYRNGSAPYGVFPGSSCSILTAWKNLSGSFTINGWTKYDVGVCSMGNNSSGESLNDMVGWMGRQWNAPYVRSFFTLGYPFKNTNNIYINNAGLYLRTCTAESFQQTTDTRGLGCNWGSGISGGPWMTAYAPNVVSGYANGVNSGIYIGTTNMYGIRFTSANIVPLCNVEGC